MELQATIREKLGTSASKKLRREKLIPAELYGHNLKNAHLTVDERAFGKLYKEAGESQVVTLTVNSKKHPVLIHEVTTDPLKGNITHVDFHEVNMDEKIVTHISVEFIGESPAVKEKIGVLNKAVTEIEVEALPAKLPEHIEVDISSLKEVGESVQIKDLSIPEGVKIFLDPETAVAAIMALAEEEVEETPVSVEDVQVESELKKAERDQDKKEDKKE